MEKVISKEKEIKESIMCKNVKESLFGLTKFHGNKVKMKWNYFFMQ